MTVRPELRDVLEGEIDAIRADSARSVGFAALLRALDEPDLRATAAYLLGRAGFQPYPERRRDRESIRVALRRHLDDDSTFEDPFYRQTFRTRDFVLAALIRIMGPDRFDFQGPRPR